MIPHLQMNSVQGRIGIQSSRAQIEIHSNHAEQSIQQPKAELHIDRTPSKLSIDQTQAWNNLNLKSVFVRIRDAATAGHQAAMEGIARRAEQGDELMKIENGGNPIVSQAVENSEHHGSYDTGSVPPFEAVKIHYQPSRVNIQWQTHAPIISAKQNHPTINYQPGQVNIYMDQYPSLSIKVVGGQINTTA
jgi:hypothetical protein